MLSQHCNTVGQHHIDEASDRAHAVRELTLATIRERKEAAHWEEEDAAAARRAEVNGFEADRRREGPIRLVQCSFLSGSCTYLSSIGSYYHLLDPTTMQLRLK
jgi:hypothetical protein